MDDEYIKKFYKELSQELERDYKIIIEPNKNLNEDWIEYDQVKKDNSDLNNIKYIAVDWYGRIIDEKWKENRKKHNRRVCYEFARLYAKAINELLKDNHNLEAVMVGDRMDTDVISGMESGMSTVLVLSGCSTKDTLKTYAYRPTMVLNGVGDIATMANSKKK